MDPIPEFRSPRAAEIDAYWAGRLGVPEGWAVGRTVHVVPDENLVRERFAVFRRGEATVARCHPGRLGTLGLLSDGCDDIAALRRRGEPWRTERLSYLEPTEVVLPEPAGTLTRRLKADDRAAFEAFLDGCSPEDVKRADVRLAHPGLYGVFAEGTLVAAASLIHHGPTVTDVGILVHPDHRRRGHGRRAVAATARCEEVGPRIVQYCTLESNTGSLRIARSLGFRLYAIEEWFQIAPA